MSTETTTQQLDLKVALKALVDMLKIKEEFSDPAVLYKKLLRDMPKRFTMIDPLDFFKSPPNHPYRDFLGYVQSKSSVDLDETPPEAVNDATLNISLVALAEMWEVISNKLGSTPNEFICTLKDSKGLYYPLADPVKTPLVTSLCEDTGTDIVKITAAFYGALAITEDLLCNELEKINQFAEPNPRNTLIRDKINSIMAFYDRLYKPAFISRPFGVLTPKGVLRYDKQKQEFFLGRLDEDYLSDAYMVTLYKKYQALDPTLPTDYVASNFKETFVDIHKGEALIGYLPKYHLMNLYGLVPQADGTLEQVNAWSEYSAYIKWDLTEKFNALIEPIGAQSRRLAEGEQPHDDDRIVYASTAKILNVAEEMLTTIIIVEDYDINASMKLKDVLPRRTGTISKFLSKKPEVADIFGVSESTIRYQSPSTERIQTTLLLFDEKAYDSSILFAYKAYQNYLDAGNLPSAYNILLGRNDKGDNVTINVLDQNNIFTNIMAGSGSGKGVLTLSMLTGLIANEVPFAYLDHKPDMAATLWKLENQLTAQGYPTRILAVESQEIGGFTPNPRTPAYGIGLPAYKVPKTADGSKLTSDMTILKLVPYIKALQLYGVIAQLRATHVIPNGPRVIVIADEAQKVNSVLYGKGGLEATLSKLMVATQGSKKDGPLEGYSYYERMYKVLVTEVMSTLTALRTTNGRVGNVSLLNIGQSLNAVDWGSENLGGWDNTSFGTAVKNTHVRIIGKGANGAGTYGITELAQKPGSAAKKTNETMGYFVKLDSNKVPTTESESMGFFKAYLAINENDFDPAIYASGDNKLIEKEMSKTGGILKSITDIDARNAFIRDEIYNPNTGQKREEIGFLGLIDMLAKGDKAKLAASLSLGYNIAEDLATRVGLLDMFTTVEDYLYSCAPNAFYTTEEFLTAVKTNTPLSALGLANDLAADDRVEGGVTPDLFADDGFNARKTGPTLNFNTGNVNNPTTQNETVKPTPPTPDYSAVVPDPIAADDDFGALDVVADDFANVATQGSKPPTPKQQTTAPPTPNERPQVIQGVYNKPLGMKSNPFQHTGTGFFGKQAALAEATKVVLQAMKEAFGGFDRITSFDITMDGIMIINKIKFVPTLPASIVDSMPIDIQHGLHRGSIVDLFDLHYLTKFKNLASLVIEDPSFAHSRAKREIGVYNNNWKALFNKFKYLNYLSIGGKEYGQESIPDSKKDTAKEKREGKLRKAGIFSSLSPGFMSKAWDKADANPLFKATKRTFGGIIAYNGLIGLATLFGPVALVAGAVAGGLYLKNR